METVSNKFSIQSIMLALDYYCGWQNLMCFQQLPTTSICACYNALLEWGGTGNLPLIHKIKQWGVVAWLWRESAPVLLGVCFFWCWKSLCGEVSVRRRNWVEQPTVNAVNTEFGRGSFLRWPRVTAVLKETQGHMVTRIYWVKLFPSSKQCLTMKCVSRRISSRIFQNVLPERIQFPFSDIICSLLTQRDM